jgi:hypothetical protein
MGQIILDSANDLIQGDFDNATLNNRTKFRTTTTNATTNVYVVPNGTATSAGVSVSNNSNLTNASKIVMATNGTTDTQIISGVNGSGTYLPLSFYTNDALAMQINTAGNVGIGTTAPNTRLHVQGGTNADGSLTYNQQLTSTAAFNASPATGTLVSLQFNSGGSYAGMGGWSVNKENATDGNFASYLALHTRPNGGSTTERMRITSSGKLVMASVADGTLGTIQAGITANTGSTNAIICASANANGAYPLGAKGESTNQGLVGFFNSSDTAIAAITKSGNSVAYNTSSDYRLKENIVPMTGALSKVLLLKPVTYTWKEDGLAGQGFIAHELQAIVPDAVTGEKDAVETYTDKDGIKQTRIKPQGIDTSFLVATLTAAIQEQQAIINELKTRIEALENK